MGGALRGTATGAEGLLLNPSGIVIQRQFNGTALYSPTVRSHGHFLHTSLVDSTTNPSFGLGIYYNWGRESPSYSYSLGEYDKDNRLVRIVTVDGAEIVRSVNESGVVVGLPLGERLALGATIKYGHYTLRSQLTPDQVPRDFSYRNPAIDAEQSVDLGSLGHVVSFDVGMTLRLISQLRLGVVAQNLWAHGSELPTRLGLGLGYLITERLTVAADAMIDFTGATTCTAWTYPVNVTPPSDPESQDGLCTQHEARLTYQVGGGLEYVLASMIPLRAGYLFQDTLGVHNLTAGVGYQDPERGFGLDFSFQQRVAGGNETVLLFGLRYVPPPPGSQ